MMSETKCICGCGEATKGGQFRPGHDARYKSQLVREAAAGNNPEAERILAERGWTKFLEKHLEVMARPKSQPKAPRASTLRAGDTLQLMKAAAKVLRWTNQYKRGTVYTIKLTGDNAADIATLQHPELRIPNDDSMHEAFSESEMAAIRLLARSPADVVD